MHILLSLMLAISTGVKTQIPYTLSYKGIKVKSATDAYGYTYLSTQDDDTVSFNWMEITSTGTALGLSDDDSASVTLPFVFKMYKDTTTRILVQSNGGITFRDIKLSIFNHALPDTNGTMIAVYWADQNPYSHGNVYYQSIGDSMLVIEWYQVPEYNGTQYNTYEAILYHNGKIKLQYLDVPSYSDETVGIQSKDAYSSGNGYYSQYVYSSSPTSHIPSDSMAILFIPPVSQDHDIGLIGLQVTPSIIYLQDTAIITATLKNFGLNQETFELHIVIDTNGSVIMDTALTVQNLDTNTIKDTGIIYIPSEPNKFRVTAYTACQTDTNYINDTTYEYFEAISDMPLPYITDFESDSGYFYHEGANDPWAWGQAAHTHSGTHAWATGLDTNYPSYSDGILYTYPIDLSSFSPYDSTYLDFWYMDSLESNYDYVYLMITKDRGQTWDTVRVYNGYNAPWTEENVDLKPYNGNKIQIAFKIESDSYVAYAGFFLDDLKIGIPLDNDAGIRAITVVPRVSRPGDTVDLNVIVHNFGLQLLSGFNVVTEVHSASGTLMTDTTYIGILIPSEDTILAFDLTPTDTGEYSVLSYTILPTDEYNGNDTTGTEFTVGGPNYSLRNTLLGGMVLLMWVRQMYLL